MQPLADAPGVFGHDSRNLICHEHMWRCNGEEAGSEGETGGSFTCAKARGAERTNKEPKSTFSKIEDESQIEMSRSGSAL